MVERHASHITSQITSVQFAYLPTYENRIRYFDELYDYNYTFKAVSCIIASFEVYVNSGKLEKNAKVQLFLESWIDFLVSETEFPNCDLYKKLLCLHE